MTSLDEPDDGRDDDPKAAAERTRQTLLAKETELRESLAAGTFQGIDLDIGRGGRGWGVIFLILGLVLVATGMIGVGVAFSSEARWAGIVASVCFVTGGFGFVPLITGLYMLKRVLALPLPSGRTTPLRGLRAFVGAMRVGRFEYAWQCLLPSERTPVGRRRPPVPFLGLRSQQFAFAAIEGFTNYWGSVVEAANAVTRFAVAKEQNDLALASCYFEMRKRVAGSPGEVAAGALLTVLSPVSVSSAREEFENVYLKKLLRRVDGQWYVVNGELAGAEDTPEAFEEAVRISKLSDAELAAEAEAAGLQS